MAFWGDGSMLDGVEALVGLKVESCDRRLPFSVCGCWGVDDAVEELLESREPEGERMLPLSDVTVPERREYNE